MGDPPQRFQPDRILDYAQPRKRRSGSFMCVFAITFAVIAIGMGGLFAIGGIGMLGKSSEYTTERDRRTGRNDGLQMLLCSAVLIVPGVWYGRVAL